jgi:uncharacterized protein
MLKPETIAIQKDLASYCLTGKSLTTTSLSPQRLSHYRRLVYNVFYGILEQAYPVAFNHLNRTIWNSLVDDFVAEHACSDPQVWKMPKDLIDFTKNHAILQQHPYLLDLLKLEWMEIEVHCMVDVELPKVVPANDLLDEPLYFNPHHRILPLTYPVHKINKLQPAKHIGQYFILAFRDLYGKVHFISLNASHAIILDSMIQNPGLAASEILAEITSDSIENVGENTDTSLLQLLDKLVDKGFILGLYH